MKNKIYHDREGNVSSKRLSGFFLLLIGVIYLLTVGIMSIYNIIADSQTALEIGKVFIFAGSGLLGISVIEFLGKKEEK